MVVFSNASYGGEHPFRVEVPEPVAEPFQALFASLTGHVPSGLTVMFMLHYLHWRTMRGPVGLEDRPTRSQAMGWAFFETIHGEPKAL